METEILIVGAGPSGAAGLAEALHLGLRRRIPAARHGLQWNARRARSYVQQRVVSEGDSLAGRGGDDRDDVAGGACRTCREKAGGAVVAGGVRSWVLCCWSWGSRRGRARPGRSSTRG